MMQSLSRFLLISLLAYSLGPVRGSHAADAAQIHAQLSTPDTILQVADPFWISVTVSATNGADVVFPDVPAKLGPFNVLSHRDWFDVPVERDRNWTRNFQLESLEGGDLEVPPIEVSVDGTSLSSEPVSITITSLVEAEADPFSFRDIKPAMEIPDAAASGQRWTGWAIAGVGLAAVLALAMWMATRKKEVSATDWALSQLDKLRESDEFDRRDADPLMIQLSDIVREFVERQFAIPATRQTTDEFLAGCQHDTRLSASQRTSLQTFLEHIDDIKFARLKPDAGRVEDSFRIVRKFVISSSESR